MRSIEQWCSIAKLLTATLLLLPLLFLNNTVLARSTKTDASEIIKIKTTTESRLVDDGTAHFHEKQNQRQEGELSKKVFEKPKKYEQIRRGRRQQQQQLQQQQELNDQASSTITRSLKYKPSQQEYNGHASSYYDNDAPTNNGSNGPWYTQQDKWNDKNKGGGGGSGKDKWKNGSNTIVKGSKNNSWSSGGEDKSNTNNYSNGRSGGKSSNKGGTSNKNSNGKSGRYPSPSGGNGLNEVTLCYEESMQGLDIRENYYTNSQGDIVSTVDVIEIIDTPQDVYAKVVGSTFSFMDLQTLDESCFSQYGYSTYYLEGLSSGSIDVRVVLNPLGTDTSGVIEPFPTSQFNLKFDSLEALTYYEYPDSGNKDGQPNDRRIKLQSNEQSIGEFYFSNVQPGRYLVQFQFFVQAALTNVCAPYYPVSTGPALSQIKLGPYVLTYQKINLLQDNQCQETITTTQPPTNPFTLEGGAESTANVPIATGRIGVVDNEEGGGGRHHRRRMEEESTLGTSGGVRGVIGKEREGIDVSRRLKDNESDDSNGMQQGLEMMNVRKGGGKQQNSNIQTSKNQGGKGGNSSNDDNNGNNGPSLPLVDNISMCYTSQAQGDVTLQASVDGTSEQDEQSAQVIIDFATFNADNGDDFYAHVLASTFSSLSQLVRFDCTSTNGEQYNEAQTLITLKVVLQRIASANKDDMMYNSHNYYHYDGMSSRTSAVFIEANPSSNIILRNDTIFQNTEGTFESDSQEVFSQRSPRNGNFYFHNVPSGTYTLSFVIDITVKAKSNCLLGPPLAPFFENSFAEAALGDRVVTLEKINISKSTICRANVSNINRSRRKLISARQKKEKEEEDRQLAYKDDDENSGTDEQLSNIQLCYLDEYEVDAIIQDPVPVPPGTNIRNTQTKIIDINFGNTIEMNGSEDLHTKISLSNFVLHLHTLRDIASLPSECQPSAADRSIQETRTNTTTAIMSIELRPTSNMMKDSDRYSSRGYRNDYGKYNGGYYQPQPSIVARPSQSIVLTLTALDITNFFNPTNVVPPTNDYSMAFGLSRQGGQSTGEFYFLNVPQGSYELFIHIELVASAYGGCGQRLLKQHTQLNQRHLQGNNDASPVAHARAVIGPHVISIEKIDAIESGTCATLTSEGRITTFT